MAVFILTILLFFSIAAHVEAQDLNAYVGVGNLAEQGFPQHYQFTICNDQQGTYIDLFQLSELPSGAVVVESPAGWSGGSWADGQAGWEAGWNSVPGRGCVGPFGVYVPESGGWKPVHFVLGAEPDNFTLGWTWGPGGAS